MEYILLFASPDFTNSFVNSLMVYKVFIPYYFNVIVQKCTSKTL